MSTTPTPVTATPFMTIIAYRYPREKVHRTRGHAHAALAAKVGYRNRLYSDAALYQYVGGEWRLLWEGKRGDDVSGKPWADVPTIEALAEPDTVTLSRERYDDLVDSEAKLLALEAGGVDNWTFYDESMAAYWEARAE